MLVTLADQCDHKLMQYREEEKAEIRELKEEKKRLLEFVAQLKNEKLGLQTQVDKVKALTFVLYTFHLWLTMFDLFSCIVNWS
jgi:hypothetical protein